MSGRPAIVKSGTAATFGTTLPEDIRVDVLYEATAVKVVIASGVFGEEAQDILVEFSLRQNCPNPFSPTTFRRTFCKRWGG